MVSPDFKRNLTALGVIVLPLVVVQSASLFIGAGMPSGAAAATDPQAPATPSAAVVAPKCTPQQIEAAKHAMLMLERPFAQTPFLYELSNAPTAPEEPARVSAPDDDAPKFTLQAVLASEFGRKALINGRPYREGQVVRETSWLVLTIDSEQRLVVLRHLDSDRTSVVRVELPH